MNKILSRVFIPLSMFAALFFGVMTAGMAEEDKGLELNEAVVITAEVLAINKADRVVTLRGSEDDVVEVVVGEEAQNLDQINVGDQLKITYYASVALYLGEPGAKPEEDAGVIVARAEKGEKPAGLAVAVVDVSATIVKINKKERSLKLKLADGKKVTTEVDESVAAFDTLKKGDTVHARLTKAIAISVEKP